LSELRLGPQDAGRTVEVAAGDRLVVALPEIAGTGYTWAVEALPPGGRVLEERYEHAAGTGIGGASQHVFVIDPGGGGSVGLRQSRPGTADARERFEAAVTVSGGPAPPR
jgi:predicted secreted protein